MILVAMMACAAAPTGSGESANALESSPTVGDEWGPCGMPVFYVAPDVPITVSWTTLPGVALDDGSYEHTELHTNVYALDPALGEDNCAQGLLTTDAVTRSYLYQPDSAAVEIPVGEAGPVMTILVFTRSGAAVSILLADAAATTADVDITALTSVTPGGAY